jgi:hypothetical protein
MANGITWPKDVRDRSKADGTMLLAFGNPIVTYIGHAEKGIAEKVCWFALRLTRGESPEVAFDAIFGKKEIVKHDK